MSTEVTVNDLNELETAIADVRSDATETDWCLINHVDGNPNVIGVCCAGTGGAEEMIPNLDASQCMYGLVRLTETIDMSNTTKFVYVIWYGKDVSFVKKGKYGVVSGSVEKFFSPYQVSVTADSQDEVSTEALMTKLQETSGTKNKVLDASEGKTRPERGFVASSSGGRSGPLSPTRPGGVPSKVGKQGSQFSGFTSQAKGGATLKIDETVVSKITAVRSDEDESCWLVITFPNNDVRKPCQVSAEGDKLEEFSPQDVFNPTEIALALIRVTDVVDDIPTVKFVYILWVGDEVKPMAKGRLAPTKGELEELFNPFHVHIQASAHSEVRLQLILDKVGHASGSKSSVK